MAKTKAKTKRRPARKPTRQALSQDLRLGELIVDRLSRFSGALQQTTIVVRRKYYVSRGITYYEELGGELSAVAHDLPGQDLQTAVCRFLTSLSPAQLVSVSDATPWNNTIVIYYRRPPIQPQPDDAPH